MSISGIIFFVLAMTSTPGPNNILTMANAGKYGYRKTIPFIIGVITGMFSLMIVTIFLGTWMLEFVPKVKSLIGIVGAVYMMYLAYRIIFAKGNRKSSGEDELQENSSFVDGLVMQIMNPKTIFFIITLMTSFVLPNAESVLIAAMVSILVAIELFFSLSMWAMFGLLFQKILTKNKMIYNCVIALLLVYSALTVSGIISFS